MCHHKKRKCICHIWFVALYIEQRIDQLEAHAVKDGRLPETVAKGVATLTLQVQRNQEQTNQLFNRTNQRIDDLVTTLGDVKTTLSVVLRLLETKLP